MADPSHRQLSVEEAVSVVVTEMELREAWRREQHARHSREYRERSKHKPRYRAANRISTNRYRCRRMGIEPELTADQFLTLLVLFDGQCAYCDWVPPDPMMLEIDHAVPLGMDDAGDGLGNIAVACRECNNAKKDNHWEDWVPPAKHDWLTGILESSIDFCATPRWEAWPPFKTVGSATTDSGGMG